MIGKIKNIVGIYNADGGIIGELTYVVKKIAGKTKCDLCTLTHATVSEKDEWKKFVKESPIKITTVHINEQVEVNEKLSEFTANRIPCVVSIYENDHMELLFSAEELEKMEGDTPKFIGEIKNKLNVIFE